MLALRNLSKSYVAGTPVLQDVNLEVGARGITAIIGASGTGKSTLIRCINRLVEPTSGAILFHDQDLAGSSGPAAAPRAPHIGMVFQEYNLVERLTVMENLLTGGSGTCRHGGRGVANFRPRTSARAFELLDVVGSPAFAQQRADALSGGSGSAWASRAPSCRSPGCCSPTSRRRRSIRRLGRDHGAARDGRDVALDPRARQHARRRARQALRRRIVGMRGGKIVFDGVAADLDDAKLTMIYGGEGWLQ
jgi:phosphonate transport system ATP-binding protein